jgi:hypothetical protein
MGIKLILKEIPFNIPKFQEALDYYAKGGAVTETLKTELKPSSLAFKLKYSLLKYTYKRAFNMVDAHVDYTEEAIEVFEVMACPRRRFL